MTTHQYRETPTSWRVRRLPRRPGADVAAAELLLRTLGHPALTRGGVPVEGLRRKDLALLAYLGVEGKRFHPRGLLAALLWGESGETKARHSLTQAIGRIQRATGGAALVVERDAVRAAGALRCDADALLGRGVDRQDELLPEYAGAFLDGFDAGFGSEEFEQWAGRRRAELRNLALRRLDRAGEEAEAAGDWKRALRIGERAVEIDAVWERGHRRVLRALLHLGERNHALRHYRELERWLESEVGGAPDPDTLALARRMVEPRSEAPPSAEPRAPAAFVAPPPVRGHASARPTGVRAAGEASRELAAARERPATEIAGGGQRAGGSRGGVTRPARRRGARAVGRLALAVLTVLAAAAGVRLALHHGLLAAVAEAAMRTGPSRAARLPQRREPPGANVPGGSCSRAPAVSGPARPPAERPPAAAPRPPTRLRPPAPLPPAPSRRSGG